MNSLQDKLKNLRPYVVGIRFIKETPVVDVNIKDGWKLLSSDKILINKSEKIKNYYMFYSENETVDIDDILNFVEECINYNKEIEAKEVLYRTYLSTLKSLFENSTYEEFKTLEFKFQNKVMEKE